MQHKAKWRSLMGVVATAVLLIDCVRQSEITPVDLMCEARNDPTGIATTMPRFSWKNEAGTDGVRQSAYQVVVASSVRLLEEGKPDLWNSGKVESSKSIWVEYAGTALKSRALAYWKVKVWDQDGVPSKWSTAQHFSVGLLREEDWKGEYIAMDPDGASHESPLVRKTFVLDEKYDALYLHVNSLGYHELYINDQRVGDAVLAPAESQYDKRSFSLTYDVSPYLRKGKNAVVLWLGYGWYRHFAGRAHNGPVVRAQLDALKDGRWETLVKTDGSWKVSGSEYVVLEHRKFGGEILDLNRSVPAFADPGLDDATWEPATVVHVPDHLVTPQVVEVNRVRESIVPVAITEMEDGVYLVDMGKNLTGRAVIRFPVLPKGHEVTIEYADHLVSKYPELFELQSNKPGYRITARENEIFARQRDQYISSGEAGVFTNKFNYRAFRYMKIINMPVALPKEAITGELIHTDFREAASFSCSDEMLNDIHDMFAYTLKCLTLGGKTVDCPHYERLGYGGDGNASTITAQTMYDLAPLYTTWLTHWADCNGPDGDMPHTAPTFWSSGGGPYWCAFMIKAAWETYINYGDERVLHTFYPYMVNWLGYVQKHSPNILLEPWPTTENRNWYLGDWATPEGIDQTDPRSIGVVTNCAIVDSYDKMIRIAGVLGKTSDMQRFTEKKVALSRAIHAEYYNPETATYGTGVQIDLAYPLIMEVVPDSLKEKVTESLRARILEDDRGHWATGLVGLPVMTAWIADNEASELMYMMMTQKDYPGFGYMLEHGATTTWEHWRGERSRIHNCYHGPGSWYYRSIGGVQPLEEYPGYERFQLAPRPPEALTWAKVTKESPYGTIGVDWRKDQDEMIMEVAVPTGSAANLVLPAGVQTCTIDGELRKPDQDGNLWIQSGRYRIQYTQP